MLHEPAAKMAEDKAYGYKSKLGVKLFAIYCFIYAGFVFISAFAPKVMQTKIIFGLNLAITYGFGLIIFAIVLGLFYNRLCKKAENKFDKPEGEK